jgi:mxaL protein
MCEGTRFWLLAAAALLFAATAASPRLSLRRNAYNVLAVVDITGSMNVRDYQMEGRPVSRLDFAKAALVRLLAVMPCQSKLGLAIFSERRPFLLFEPAETCENFAAITGAIDALDWRMAWEGDSHVAAGLYRSVDLAKGLDASLLFISDGQEAPPLPLGGAPAFEGKPGEVRGLIAGAGGYGLSPIPRFDEEGRETGAYAAEDVPQENRVGPPPRDAQFREGWHERNAPFGAAAAMGSEHLSSVRERHLNELAGRTGLAYAHLDGGEQLAQSLLKAAAPRLQQVPTPMGFIPAAVALTLTVAAYAAALFNPEQRKETPR